MDDPRSHTSSTPMRIQLHSHDSFGLGHLRRSMTIAQALHESFPSAEIMITTGSPCATHFGALEGIEVVKLPSVTKDENGSYRPRSLQGDVQRVVRLRREMLVQIHRSFAPHVLLVDHQVLGLCDELEPVLLEARGRGTRTILGVRDIIDTPEAVARDWGRPAVRRALREAYDRVCVYGVPEVFDARAEYPFPPELAARLEYVGYVARPVPPRAQRSEGRKRVLVTVGGGEDGAARIDSYLDALEVAPPAFDSTILLGPLAQPERVRGLKKRVKDLAHVHLQSFHADLPHLLAESDAVVSMAGYNSTVEVLQSRVPAVFCPRSFPRREQLLRAERLQALGLAECLPNPRAQDLRATIERLLGHGLSTRALPAMDGCARLAEVVRGLQSVARTAAQGSFRP